MKLGEYYCFYANKQGVTNEILQKVGDKLDKSQQEQESNTFWYYTMFD